MMKYIVTTLLLSLSTTIYSQTQQALFIVRGNVIGNIVDNNGTSRGNWNMRNASNNLQQSNRNYRSINNPVQVQTNNGNDFNFNNGSRGNTNISRGNLTTQSVNISRGSTNPNVTRGVSNPQRVNASRGANPSASRGNLNENRIQQIQTRNESTPVNLGNPINTNINQVEQNLDFSQSFNDNVNVVVQINKLPEVDLQINELDVELPQLAPKVQIKTLELPKNETKIEATAITLELPKINLAKAESKEIKVKTGNVKTGRKGHYSQKNKSYLGKRVKIWFKKHFNKGGKIRFSVSCPKF